MPSIKAGFGQKIDIAESSNYHLCRSLKSVLQLTFGDYRTDCFLFYKLFNRIVWLPKSSKQLNRVKQIGLNELGEASQEAQPVLQEVRSIS
jgi:hypothetical protein